MIFSLKEEHDTKKTRNNKKDEESKKKFIQNNESIDNVTGDKDSKYTILNSIQPQTKPII